MRPAARNGRISLSCRARVPETRSLGPRTALTPAFFGGALLGSWGGAFSYVTPDTAADEEEGEPGRRGEEHLDDLRDPVGLPERREAERENEDHAQRREHGRNRHSTDPHQQAQTPSSHPTPLRP